MTPANLVVALLESAAKSEGMIVAPSLDGFVMDTSGNPRRRGELFNISRDTWLEWRAHAGNAKARRRWKRRGLPNSQRTGA